MKYKMDNDGGKCKKTKLAPPCLKSYSVVENTLARIKRPCKKALPAVAIATQSRQINTHSIGKINSGRSNIMPMNFEIKIEVENVDENAIEKQHEIISWREIVKKSTEIYIQSNNIGDKTLHGQISVPKTIGGDRLKSTPAKHDSPVDSQKNTLLLSHDIQDMVNDRDDDDVIIIDNVPEVIVIPSDDAPNNLPCVIANIKSEPLENELQTSKTKHTVTPQNRFKCKTMVTQLPKVTKDVFKCRSDGNKINDDKVLSIEEIKREPELKGNSEMNVSMESTFGIINTQSMTTNNVNTINNIKKLIPKTKQTLLTDVSRNLESDVKIEVIKSEEEKLMREDLSDIQLNKQKREEGRPADMSNNLEQITPKESEVSEPLKAETIVETVVEVDIPWDAVLIKEESDPEMDLQISDTRRIYHVDVVNVGENKIDVKQEINEFDSTGLSENWHQDSFPFLQHSSDDEFENDFITISPNVALNTDDESNRTQRKKEILYSCIRCNFKGVHRLYKQHKRYECQKTIHLYNYHCSLCKKSFDSMPKYLLHFETHGVPELICPQCGHGGISLKSLSLHVKMHIKSLFVSYRSLYSEDTITAPVLKCKVCYADVTRVDFIKHWDTHLDLNNLNRRLKSPEVLLPQLPHGFQTLDHDDTPGIKKALNLFMNPEKLMDIERKNFRVCILCERQFNRRNDCKRHLIEHFLKNAYSNKTRCNGLKCQICGDVFEKIDMFRGHMRLHACLPVYKCEICDRTFSDSSNFSKHKKVHNFQILICDICKKKFTNKAYLAKHIKDHERTPIIKCDKCKKTFVCNSAYKKHYRTNHSRCLRFRCHECNQLFSTTRDKWDHMWNVHREREVEADCNLCDAKFRKKSDLKRHFASMHKKKAPDITNDESEDVNVESETE